ncbi:MAG: hypothetical protein IKI30_03175 [Oxalobacter sp.]|nr:hypothetical protein [Oxalobacter sp.]
MGILNLLKKKPKEAVMAEAIESANLARRKMVKHRNIVKRLRGVPLPDIENCFSDERVFKTDYDGDVLVINHEPFTTRVEVVAPSIMMEDGKAAALIQITTLVEKPFDAYIQTDADINTLNANAAGGALIRAKDGRLLVSSRFTWFWEGNVWQDELMPLIVEAALNGPRAILLSEKNRRDGRPPRYSGISALNGQDFAAIREALPAELACTADDAGLFAELPLPFGGKTALVQLDKSPVNPYLGPGVKARINLPDRFKASEECLAAANLLNRKEMSLVIPAWHYGAWYARENNGLSYTCFFPNSLCANSAIFSRWLQLMQTRVDWVTRDLMDKW